MHPRDPGPARTNRHDGAQDPKAWAKRAVEDEETENKSRPGHEQGIAEDAQTGADGVQRDARGPVVKGLARKPSRDLWANEKHARDQPVHDLLHEPDQTPDPIETRGDADGHGEREQGFGETFARLLSTIRHDGFLRDRRFR